MAAPSKLTPDRQDLLCAAISEGNYYETACALVGIDYATFRRWMAEGEQAKSGVKREFCDAVTRAQAEAEARVVALWQSRIPEDWQAARDFLARRHPERWGRTVQDTRHQGPDGGVLRVEVVYADADDHAAPAAPGAGADHP